MNKPSLPKGTRDFGPLQMSRRKFILNKIEQVFLKYGFQPLETPAMENLSVLTGKYGEEGDKLLFRTLNSGDYLKKTSVEDYNKGAETMLPKIAEKGLRYDLTVPFARYVVMNQHEITFPFKRYQIQPVWRADRPQKGRYREFFQCDADVVGTDSLICEADIIMMIDEVFSSLGIKDYTIKLNHRKLLSAMAEIINASDKASDLFVAMDKLDKIGKEGVEKELLERGFEKNEIEKLNPFFTFTGDNKERLSFLEEHLGSTGSGKLGVSDVKQIFSILAHYDHIPEHLLLDFKLARGLSYYTGAIFETVVNNVSIGSVSGGGRYDDLTGVFGLTGVSGVGFSFGIDRLYDVMEELDLFPEETTQSVKALMVFFNEQNMTYGLGLLPKLRNEGISCEIYPDQSKLKKQLTYANKKNIPFVIIIGDEEQRMGKLTLKNMITGEEEKLSLYEIVEKIK
ncbi:MAG: histidine--tRNA ligase [Candidatus Cyclobacteriaceae bacterium M2_1C_046]